jgi:cytoskeletal protein CcmA (bactofilin family)
LAKGENVKDLNLVGIGSTVEGKIKSKGSVRIDGRLVGEVVANENLFIGETGEVDGTLSARNVTIGGKVKGAITAGEKLVFEAKSQVRGEIKAAKLVIDEGAVFDGKCTMADAKQPQTHEQKS